MNILLVLIGIIPYSGSTGNYYIYIIINYHICVCVWVCERDTCSYTFPTLLTNCLDVYNEWMCSQQGSAVATLLQHSDSYFYLSFLSLLLLVPPSFFYYLFPLMPTTTKSPTFWRSLWLNKDEIYNWIYWLFFSLSTFPLIFFTFCRILPICYIYIYIYIHTHTHTHIYIYINKSTQYTKTEQCSKSNYKYKI